MGRAACPLLSDILERAWENVLGRPGEPMAFRVFMQPAMATFLAIRAGIRDARAGTPPFLWAVLTDPTQRAARLRQAWRDVSLLFCVALVLDAIYQVFAHGGVYVGEMLVVAVLLAFVPYAIFRGPAARIAKHWVGPSRAEAQKPESDRSPRP